MRTGSKLRKAPTEVGERCPKKEPRLGDEDWGAQLLDDTGVSRSG